MMKGVTATKAQRETIDRLHRHHCDATATRLTVDLPTGEILWRGEGSQGLAVKEAVAHRLAVCWNVLEGMPTESLLDGALRDLFDAIRERRFDDAAIIVAHVDDDIDHTNGRAHDCAHCLREAKR